MNQLKKIVCLIPCLNEEQTLVKVINDLNKYLSKPEIHVFDNNSKDNSLSLAKQNGAIVHSVSDLGKGNVVRRMFADVSGDVFVMVDADDTYELKNLDSMIKKLLNENLDMIVGKRISSTVNAYRPGHKLGNRIFSKLVKLIFGDVIDDLFSGLRIFSKRFVKSFPGHSSGFEIETELTIHALEQRLPVAEVDCNYKARPKGSVSKLNTFKDGFRILNVILILIKDEKPLLFFSILSFSFIFLSLFLGIPVILEYLETGLVDRLPTAILSGLNMIIAFLSFFSGLILDVIKKSRHERKRFNYVMIKK